MATIDRIGYGQVEPNHLSAQRTGQIYAQLPMSDDMEQLENGQFVKYDYVNGEVDFTGEGEWMLVFNEIKLYDDKWRETYKDFVMLNDKIGDGKTHEGYGPFAINAVPRVFKTNVGDIFTTNCFDSAGSKGVLTEGTSDLEVGDVVGPNSEGFLEKDSTDDMSWQVVKVYTMPDGQAGVKLMRIK